MYAGLRYQLYAHARNNAPVNVWRICGGGGGGGGGVSVASCNYYNTVSTVPAPVPKI